MLMLRCCLLSLFVLLSACQTHPALQKDNLDQATDRLLTDQPVWNAVPESTTVQTLSDVDASNPVEPVKPFTPSDTSSLIDPQSDTDQQIFVEGWLVTFQDNNLETLVEQALSENADLRVSANNISIQLEQARIIGAPLWPQLDARFGASRNRSDNPFSPDQSFFTTNYTADLNLSWQFDIWGRIINQRQAATWDVQTQMANYAAARLALVANVTRAWFNLRSLKQQLQLAEQQLQLQQQTLRLIEDLYRNGTRTALDVYLNRTTLENQQVSILELQRLQDTAIRQLKVLLNHYPDNELTVDTSILPDLPAIPVGLPSALLQRRPDIIAARAQWQSARLNAYAAHKARFPGLQLTGNLGKSSSDLESLDVAEVTWSIVGGLVQPLFQGGRLKAQAMQAALQTDSNLQQYVSVLLTAFSEVEISLNNENQYAQQLQATRRAADFAQGAYDLSLQQYQNGLINFQDLLTAQRNLFDAKDSVIRLQNTLLQNRIDLYLALGGNF